MRQGPHHFSQGILKSLYYIIYYFYGKENRINGMRISSTSFLCLCVLGLLLMAAGCTQSQPDTAASTPGSPEPGNYTSNETLVAFVESAVAYAHANGKEKALAEFSDPNGTFVQGELYIYAYDFNNVALAHPFDPDKISVSRMDELDAFGNPYTRQFIDAAKNGFGFVRFYYINPAHNRTVESKLGYVVKVDEDWWLGSGTYTGPAPTPVHTSPATIPDLTGNWTASMAGYEESMGFSDYPTVTMTMTMTISDQHDRIVSGYTVFTTANGTETRTPIAGVIGRDGRTLATAEQDGGYCFGEIVGPDEIQLTYLQDGPQYGVAIDSLKRI